MEQHKVTLRVAISMTTPGAILLSALAPALFGLLLAIRDSSNISPILAIILLLIPSLLNASGNVLNDYHDYVKGNDTKDNVVSEDDGPLAYYQVDNPKVAYWFGIGLFLVAAILGVYVIIRTGIIPAAIGVIGAIIMLTYSGGILPTSYMPIGEVLSGFTMGGLIPLGVYAALTGELNFSLLYQAIPMMLIISQFMLGNNTCDIVRDKQAGRKTLPILIGREASEKLANILNIFWLIDLWAMVIIYFPKGWLALVLTLPLFLKGMVETTRQERTNENKINSVKATALTALSVAVGYPLAILIHLILR